MMSDKPLSYACKRTGLSTATIAALGDKDPSWGIYRLTPNGKRRVDPERFEKRLQEEKDKQSRTFQGAVRGGAGEHHMPEAQLAKYAAYDLRHVLLYASEPEHSPYWRNAKFVRSDLPSDIVAGFDLNPLASFEIAVEHADKLLSLPSDKQAVAMNAIAARLAAFHGGDEV